MPRNEGSSRLMLLWREVFVIFCEVDRSDQNREIVSDEAICNFCRIYRARSWVAGNEVIAKNLNANIPGSLSYFLLPFLAVLCFPASAQCINSSLQWLNSVSLQSQNRKRGQPRFCSETELGHCRLESMH